MSSDEISFLILWNGYKFTADFLKILDELTGPNLLYWNLKLTNKRAMAKIMSKYWENF